MQALPLQGTEKMRILSGRTVVAVLCPLVVAPIAAGGNLPDFAGFQLQARSNLCANPKSGTFNLPCDVFFTNTTPVLNDAGSVVLSLDVMGGTGSQGVWFGGDGAGEIVYTSPEDANVGDAWINATGFVVFAQTFSAANGIYFYNSGSDTSGLETSLPAGATSWGTPIVNNSGEVGFRATFLSGQAYYSYDGSPTLAQHAAEVSLESGSPYSFLFSPAFNNNRQIAAHVRLGSAGQVGNERPDEIRVFNANGSSVLIAQDKDGNAASPYFGFDSSRPALLDDGRVAFVATLAAGARGVFLSDGSTTTTIATTGTPGVSAIDFFPTAANSSGLVAFRGKDSNGLDAIFVGNGADLLRVIGEHDLIDTDQGEARIDQHDSAPVFGGSITINADGEIAFQCALTPPDDDQVEWGTGVYVATIDAAVPGDVNGDGVVDIDDLLAVISAWGQANSPADLNHDGIVDVDDLLLVIGNWS
jgi:hypothetical protein